MATPEVVEGELIRLEFIPVVGNTPTILLRETVTLPKVMVTLFDRRQEVQNQRAIETRNGLNYVYTISEAQPGRYFVICQDGKYSNELNIDVKSRSEETDQGRNQ